MTATQTATFTIEGVNDAPGPGADSYETSEGATLTATAGANGLLDVTDPEGDPVTLSTTLVTNVANGALSISADGSFEYTPGDGFVGTDTFVYQLSDDNGATSTATAQISSRAIRGHGSLSAMPVRPMKTRRCRSMRAPERLPMMRTRTNSIRVTCRLRR
ncbi:MAG: Ig-like domain-containing protein [Gammaproteobacteria bacterium]|nr:Ig-like domain-containing protein [Gammaproteobacteria bacterium]